MSATVFKSSINVKSAGNARQFAANLKPSEEALFATIIGVASGVSKRVDPKDPDKFYYGLTGTFEAMSFDGSEAVGAATLFAPDAIHEKIAERLTADVKTVSFAFEVYMCQGGTAGYTWKYRFLQDGEPEQEDILSGVRHLALTARDKVAQLPAPGGKKMKAAS